MALPDREFMVDRFFFFLGMSFHWILVSMVSGEKSAISLNDDDLYKISHFFLAAFKIPSWFLFLTVRWRCMFGSPEFFLFEIYWATRMKLMLFIKFWKFSAISFSTIFCPYLSIHSFWDFHSSHVKNFDCVPQVSEDLFIFLFSLSFFFQIG